MPEEFVIEWSAGSLPDKATLISADYKFQEIAIPQPNPFVTKARPQKETAHGWKYQRL